MVKRNDIRIIISIAFTASLNGPSIAKYVVK